VDASNGTTASGNDSSVGREPEAAVAAEAGGIVEQGEAIAKETAKEVVDNLGDWSGAAEADIGVEPKAGRSSFLNERLLGSLRSSGDIFTGFDLSQLLILSIW
jgi:hypothetical protein